MPEALNTDPFPEQDIKSQPITNKELANASWEFASRDCPEKTIGEVVMKNRIIALFDSDQDILERRHKAYQPRTNKSQSEQE